MRILPSSMRTSIDQGVTHFCHCWHITRRDGTVLGLTNHDDDVVFKDVRFHAEAGITLSALDARLGLDAARPEAEGVLHNGYLQADDLAAGLYDAAQFDLWLVDWQAPENRLLLMVGQFGAVRLEGDRFAVRLQPTGDGFNQPRGRLFQKLCDAALGDKRCRALVTVAPFQIEAEVLRVTGALLVIAAQSHAADWFAHGTIITHGGRRLTVRADVKTDTERHLHLWQDATALVQVGDLVQVRSGCDKQISTCKAKFSNVINYQGFPDLSDDKVLIEIASGD